MRENKKIASNDQGVELELSAAAGRCVLHRLGQSRYSTQLLATGIGSDRRKGAVPVAKKSHQTTKKNT